MKTKIIAYLGLLALTAAANAGTVLQGKKAVQ